MSFLSLTPELKIAKRVIRNLEQEKVERSARYILIESFQTPSNRLGLTFFAPVLSRFLNAKLVAFYMMPFNRKEFLKEKLRFLFSVEKAIGCKSFMYFASSDSKKYDLEAESLIRNVRSLVEFETLQYRDIFIGDLIYDVYLRKFRKPTLDLNDECLIKVVSEFIQYFDALYRKFSADEIAGVCVSHTVYFLGLPARMAAYFGVPAFQVTGESIYRIDRKNTHAYTAFKSYPELFSSLPEEMQIHGKKLAKERLDLRFAGEVGIDMHYSTKSAYHHSPDQSRVLKDNSKPHVLVAIHDFYDSPHSYGLNLFPDFYQWLVALVKISQKTDYNWYIKTHPDVRGDGISVIREFVNQNPDFTIIPSSTSHHQLIKEGISLALTIFGSIAMEYPYLGIPVMNASLNNPHVRYSFSMSPSNVAEYESLLQNINEIRVPKDKDPILEYYFVNNVYMLKSWTIKNYDAYFKAIDSRKLAHSWQIFSYFKEGRNVYEARVLQDVISNFLSSDDSFLSRKHYPHEIDFGEVMSDTKLAIFDKWDI